MKNILILCVALFVMASCAQKQSVKLIDSGAFAKEIDGKQVNLFTLKNTKGTTAQITNYGGRIVSLWTADKDGNFGDIVFGYDSIGGYLNNSESYFGALIGRYGNRIANGKFMIDSVEYALAINENDVQQLHGGALGFHDMVWDANQTNDNTLELAYISANGEQGYPGTLTVKVVYELTEADELKIEYFATTDSTTVVNLTNHAYFNLSGDANASINDHLLTINADKYLPVTNLLIPTGELAAVEGTPFDFRTSTAIGSRVNDENEQLKMGMGYDHCWALTVATEGLTSAAKLKDPKTGRTLEVLTNEPGLQFYGGNFLDKTKTGKNGVAYAHRTALCLETQHYPNSPNVPEFPSTVLKPGEKYYSICIYKFGAE